MKSFLLVVVGLIVGGVIGLGAGYYTWHGSSPTTYVGTTNTPSGNTTMKDCTATDLTLSYADDPGGGTAGSTYGKLTFRNSGQETCMLSGYPAVSLTDQASAVIGTTATHDSSIDSTGTIKDLTLAPGQTVQAGLKFTSDAATGCMQGATKLQVTLPSDKGYLSVPTSHNEWCPGFSVGPFIQNT